MRTTSYLPAEEAKLVTWTGQFLTTLQNHPAGTFGVSADRIEEYATTRTRFVNAYNLANNPNTRTRPNIEAKNDAKRTLINSTRSVVDVIQAWPQTTNEMRAELGITQRGKKPVPTPVPGTPFVKIASVNNREVTLSLQQSSKTKGKPKGVSGANVFVYYGEEPPATANGWKFETGTGKNKVTLTLNDVEEACTVWITAFWFNGRKESGPAADPVSVNLAAITPLPSAVKLRKVA